MARLRSWLVGVLLLLGLWSAAQALERSPLTSPLRGDARAVRAELARWVAWGDDHPGPVLLRLDEVAPPDSLSTRDWAALRLSTQGLVAARSGLDAQMDAALQGLRQVLRTWDNAALNGDMALIQAQAADLGGAADRAASLAAQADRLYAQACSASNAPDSCSPRHWWMALRLLASRAAAQGNLVDAYALWEKALRLSEVAQDPGLQSFTLGQMAMTSLVLGEIARAAQQLQASERFALASGSADARAALFTTQANWARAHHNTAAFQLSLARGLAYARTTGSARRVAAALVNLSDVWSRGHQPDKALAALAQALPVFRQHHDARNMAILLHNRGLAHLNLGQLKQGGRDLEEALGLWQSQGAKGRMEEALREHSDALAKRGDVSGALRLYHREQALREEIASANREALTAQLRDRYRSEAEQREIALLSRDNSLKAAQLRTQALVRRIWLLAGVLMVLVAVAVLLLWRRAREANRQLRRSEALLKVQHERDPLTGLVNRRHWRDAMLARAQHDAVFEGGLLLLDIDHFKRINDGHGHGAGDLVLVEVARRLAQAVRSSDLVCRWGGEEFLIFTPDLGGAALAALAARVLGMVGDRPVDLGAGTTLSVTASLGYASFPLPPNQVSPGWEQAVNLVDLALYTAKSMGRDRAVRLSAVQANSMAELDALEHAFQQAHRDGRVTLVDQPRAGV